MNPCRYFLLCAVVAAAFGLSFLLLPALTLGLYGMPTEPAHLLLGRYFGGALLQLGMMAWCVRDLRERATQRSLVIAVMAGCGVGGLVALDGMLEHLNNALGWSTVAIYLALVLLGLSSLKSTSLSAA